MKPLRIIKMSSLCSSLFCLVVFVLCVSCLFSPSSAQPSGGQLLDGVGLRSQYNTANGSVNSYWIDMAPYAWGIFPPEIRLTLTVFSGNPFVFMDTNPNPSNSTAPWRSWDAGTFGILINSTTISGLCGNQSSQCIFYISVVDYYNPSDYVILVTLSSMSDFLGTSNIQLPIANDTTIQTIGGLVPNGGVAYYTWTILNPANIGRDLRLIVSPIFGDAEMLISTNATYLIAQAPLLMQNRSFNRIVTDGRSVIWTTVGYGWDTAAVHLYKTDPGFCSTPANATIGCVYYILVYAKFNLRAEYVLQWQWADGALITDPPSPLMNHMSLLKVLYAGQIQSFRITAPPMISTPLEVSLSLTRLVGNATMFIQTNGGCTYNISNSVWNSETYLSNVYNEGNNTYRIPAGKTYCVTIVGNTNASFLLGASLILSQYPDLAPFKIINGLPYNDVLQDNRFRFYVFYMPRADFVRWSVSRKFGDFIAYACSQNPPVPVNVATDCITIANRTGITAGVGPVLQPGRYLLAVQATNGYTFSIDYTFTLSVASSQQTLQGGVPMPVVIEAVPGLNTTLNGTRLYTAYYQFYWPFDNNVATTPIQYQRDLIITLSMYSGHVTLYVGNVTFPNPTNYVWKSNSVRMDQVVIPFSQVQRGPYYITAVADSWCTFAVSVTTYYGTQLQPGLPANGFVDRGETHYYYLTLPQYISNNVTVSVAPIRGIVSMFISRNGFFPNANDSSTYDISATWRNSVTSTRVLMIPHLDWCRNAGPARRCRYVIAIYGDTDVRYQLQTSTPLSTNVLQAAIPQVDSIGYAYQGGGQQAMIEYGHYEFFAPSDACNLTVSLTVLGGDDDPFNTTNASPPLMYVSRNPFNPAARSPFDHAANAEWSFYHRDQATIFIDGDDPHFLPPQRSMTGWFYVEIQGPFGLIYTIGLTINDQLLTQSQNGGPIQPHQVSNYSALVVFDGQPQRRSLFIYGNHFALFQYQLPSTYGGGPVQFLANSAPYGYPFEFFVRKDGMVPTFNRSDPKQFSSGSSNTVNDLIVTNFPNDTTYCNTSLGNCTYLIGVYVSPQLNPDGFATIQFIASSAGFNYITLTNSIPIDDVYVGPGRWKYFAYWAHARSNASSMDISLNVNQGDCFLYIQRGSQLPSNSSTRANRTDGINSQYHALINDTDWYTLGIFNRAFTDGRFSISATTNHLVLLISGVPQYWQIPVDEYGVIFQYDYIDYEGNPFLLTLRPTVGNPYLEIYATFDGTRPTPTNYNYKTNSTNPDIGHRNRVTFDTTNPLYSNRTIIYIFVYNPPGPFHAAVEFSVVAKSSGFTTLVDGQTSDPVLLLPGDVEYFEFTAVLPFVGPRAPVPFLYFGANKGVLGDASADALVFVSDVNGPLPNPNSSTPLLQLVGSVGSASTVTLNWTTGNYKLLVSAPPTNTVPIVVSVVASTSVLVIPPSQRVVGSCAYPLLFTLLVQDTQNDVVLYLRPSSYSDFLYSLGLRVFVWNSLDRNQSRAFIGNERVYWTDSFTIPASNPGLQDCITDATRQGTTCRLFIFVGCRDNVTDVSYTVTAQDAFALMPVGVNNPVPRVTASAGAPKHYEIFVGVQPELIAVASPCTGNPYMWLSHTTIYPGPGNAEARSVTPGIVQSVTVLGSNLFSNTSYYLTIIPQNTESTYQLTIYDTEQVQPISLPTQSPVVTAIPGDQSGEIKVRFYPVVTQRFPYPTDIQYTVCVARDDQAANNRVLFTRCGLEYAGSCPEMYLQSSLDPGTNGMYELRPLTQLDPAATYSINVVAVLVNATNSNAVASTAVFPDLVYTAVSGVSPGGGGGDSSRSNATVIAEILAAIFLPLFILACAVALWLRRRNRMLESELSVELPDVDSSTHGDVIQPSAAPVGSAARARQRARERQAASSSALNTNRQRKRNALLDESADGGENGSSGTNYTHLLDDDHLAQYK